MGSLNLLQGERFSQSSLVLVLWQVLCSPGCFLINISSPSWARLFQKLEITHIHELMSLSSLVVVRKGSLKVVDTKDKGSTSVVLFLILVG